MFEKVSVLLDCTTISPEEFLAIDDNVCKEPILLDKDILKFVQSSKNIIDAACGDENEMNNASPVLPASEMRNFIKGRQNYLDSHRMDGRDDIELFVENYILRKPMQRKI
ncbi:hypothetical protein TNCV_30941 [Trichonephila clavipes]|nr:hypothetical protein TNCV_30941 [Trichonephila clavipes]